MKRCEFIAFVGGAAAWPALLPGEDATLAKPLFQRLQELGYSEGKNMTFEYRSAEGRPERLSQLAAELVRAKPDVLIAGFGTLTAKAAMAATRTIPIVFTSVRSELAWSQA
jgi:putative ABC transport system substrate-binding protein